MSADESYTAGLIIIGDEILKGQIIDTNSSFLTKRLHALGIKVCKLVVVSDDVDEIAEEVANYSKKYKLVITTGGIGPTHDDVTYEGVAKAFRETVELNSEMARVLQRFFPGRSCTDIEANPGLKLAYIPKSSNLIYIASEINEPSSSSFPVVQVNNVYIFPGIPEYFEYNFRSLEIHLKKMTTCTFYTRQLYLNRHEVEIVSILNTAVENYKSSVIFGSYPCISSGFYKTKLTIESTSKDQAEDAEEFLRRNLPSDSVVHLLPGESGMEPLYLLAKSVTGCKYSKDVRKSIQVLEECCDKYDLSQIFLSFNGGKDCTVLLHMAQAVFKKKFPLSKEKLQAVYIQSQNPFMEVEKFINESVKRYDLALTSVPGPIKNALGVVLKENPHWKAVLMGTRRTDPFSENLLSMQTTDEGWPQVMRVSPLLDWDYEFIWKYLKDFCVPYCSLYDEGHLFNARPKVYELKVFFQSALRKICNGLGLAKRLAQIKALEGFVCVILALLSFILSIVALSMFIDPISFSLRLELLSANCVTSKVEALHGTSKCNWTSCRQSYTAVLFSCVQVYVSYSLLGGKELDFASFPNASEITGDVLRRDVSDSNAELRLFVNTLGSGYKPQVSCGNFYREFAQLNHSFPCRIHADSDYPMAMPEPKSPPQNYRLIFALLAVPFIVCISSCVHIHRRKFFKYIPKEVPLEAVVVQNKKKDTRMLYEKKLAELSRRKSKNACGLQKEMLIVGEADDSRNAVTSECNVDELTCPIQNNHREEKYSVVERDIQGDK